MNKKSGHTKDRPAVNRKYKDTLFRMIFSNPNMPLRDLFYVAKEYQVLIGDKSIYSSQLLKLPTPTFIVFYNGLEEQPDRLEMRLSEAFEIPVKDPALELRVIQLNIRGNHNREILEKCPLLLEYATYVNLVQDYAAYMSTQDAVEKAMDECIHNDVLANFLRKNRAEAIEVSIFEYDEEREKALLKEAERAFGREQGLAEGRAEGILALISTCRELGAPKQYIIDKLKTEYHLTAPEIEEYMQQ